MNDDDDDSRCAGARAMSKDLDADTNLALRMARDYAKIVAELEEIIRARRARRSRRIIIELALVAAMFALGYWLFHAGVRTP